MIKFLLRDIYKIITNILQQIFRRINNNSFVIIPLILTNI